MKAFSVIAAVQCVFTVIPDCAASSSLYPRITVSSAGSVYPALLQTPGWVSLASPWHALTAGAQEIVIDLGSPTNLRNLRISFPPKACWGFIVSASESGATSHSAEWTELLHHEGKNCAFRYNDRLRARFRYLRISIPEGNFSSIDRLDIGVAPTLPGKEVALSSLPRLSASPVVVMETCDLWSSTAMWQSVLSYHPNNRPLSGIYDDADPSVTDARISLLRHAGIGAIQSCWFRQKGNAGKPVVAEYEGAIAALSRLAKTRNAMKWSLYWDNTNPASDAVLGIDDFLTHLTPFWIEAYFKRPNYLELDGRPILTIADPVALIAQLGGMISARHAIDAFRAQIRQAGFPDLVLLGCNNGDPRATNEIARELGLNGMMSYATPVFTGLLKQDAPASDVVSQAERVSWELWSRFSQLPTTLTVSIGYDARLWGNGKMHYRLKSGQFEQLVKQALGYAQASPRENIRSRIMFIDNWNEYGEGHFVEPSVAFGKDDLCALTRAVMATGSQVSKSCGSGAGR